MTPACHELVNPCHGNQVTVKSYNFYHIIYHNAPL
jgi:hypothetical protein